jgi:hypothetical protein
MSRRDKAGRDDDRDTGCAWPGAAVSARALSSKSGVRSHHSRQRNGGYATRCPTGGEATFDSVAIAPTGIAFAIETKTRTFDARYLAGVREMAAVAPPPAAAMVPPRSAPRPVRRARQRRRAGPGRGPGRLSRPPRAVPPSGSRNRTAPRVPGRGHGDHDVIVTKRVSIAAASACCWADPSVRIRRRARSWHNHRAGGDRRPGSIAGK